MKLRTVFVLILLFLVAGCNLNMNPSGQRESATQATPVASTKLCNGWKNYVAEVTEEVIGDGNSYLSATIIWENVSDANFIGPFTNSLVREWENLRLQAVSLPSGLATPDHFETALLGNYKYDAIGKFYVPPGFGYQVYRHRMVKVGTETTGWKIETSCGILDFKNPQGFPSYTWVGIPEDTTTQHGDLSITYLGTVDHDTCGYSDQWQGAICTAFGITNNNPGEAVTRIFRVWYLDSQGKPYIPNFDTVHDTFAQSPDQEIGPGQSVTWYGTGIQGDTIRSGSIILLQSLVIDYNNGYNETVDGTWAFEWGPVP